MEEYITNLSELSSISGDLGVISGMFLLFFWSCFLPADFILWGFVNTNPRLWVVYTLITTVASVSSGIAWFFLGKKLGRPLLEKYINGNREKRQERLIKIEKQLIKYGSFGIFLASLTPLPYKSFAIISGVINMSKRGFILYSLLGRGIRFFLGAFLVYYITVNENQKGFSLRGKIIILSMIIGLILGKIVIRRLEMKISKKKLEDNVKNQNK